MTQAHISDIKPDKSNANKGSERGRVQIEQSIREFGFADAGTLDRNNTIIGGNKRTEVAAEIGMDDVIIVDVDGTKPVFIRRNDLDLDSVDDDRARRLAYALNRSQEVSLTWDAEQLLADMTAGLPIEDFWRQDELDALLAEIMPTPKAVEDPGAQPDRAEELAAKWQTADNQIWRIGEHVVICGDCREPETWSRLLSAAGVDKVNGVFTSPPYAEQRKEQYGGVPTAEYVDWWEAVQANVRGNLANDGSFFVNIKPHCEDDGERTLYVFDLVVAMKRRFAWKYTEEFSWVHSGTPGKPQRRFKNQFEPVYQFSLNYDFRFNPDNVTHESENAFRRAGRGNVSRAQGTGRDTLAGIAKGDGEAYPGNVISPGRNSEEVAHAAAFPVALPDFFIRAYSDPGDVWLDPFLGSGTTICAAHQNGRRGFGVEKLPKYLGVILERLEQVVGHAPALMDS